MHWKVVRFLGITTGVSQTLSGEEVKAFPKTQSGNAQARRKSKKKEPKPKPLVWISSGGVGVFHVDSSWRDGGQKVWYVPRNPGKPNFLAGYPGILPEKFEKQKFVFDFGPLKKKEHTISQKNGSRDRPGGWGLLAAKGWARKSR